MTGPQLGRDAIVRAAIELFAERGVDGVSLREIHRASGHRNSSATTYHFGGKDELVEALLEQVVERHDARRVELVDELESIDRSPTLRQVLEAAIAPMLDDLADRSTRLELRMFANVVSDGSHMEVTQRLMRSQPGLGRSTAHIAGHLGHLPDRLRDERIVLATTFGLRAFADQARLLDDPTQARVPLDTATFAAQMVLLLEALLLAPAPE